MSSHKFCFIIDLSSELMCEYVSISVGMCLCVCACMGMNGTCMWVPTETIRGLGPSTVFVNPIFPVSPLTSLFYGPSLQLKKPFSSEMNPSCLYTSHPPSAHPLEGDGHLLFEEFAGSRRLDWASPFCWATMTPFTRMGLCHYAWISEN